MFGSRFDDMYELVLTFIDGRTGQRREASFTKSCADFVDEEGVLCTDLLDAAVLRLQRSLAAEKKDS